MVMFALGDKLICFAFACWILIDSVNGFAKTNDIDIPVSQIAKFGVFLLVFMRLINVSVVKTVTLLVLAYLVLLIVHVSGTPGASAEIYVYLMKPLTSLYFFFYFIHLAKKNPDNYNKIFLRIIGMNFICLAANVVIGILGLGNHVYNGGEDGEGIGVKGYIYSQNEISCVVAVLFPLILWIVRGKVSRWKYYLCCTLVLFLGFSISTKSAIIVAILSVLFVTYYLGSKKEKQIVLATSAFATISVISFISYVLSVEMGFLQRFMYFYEKDGLSEALLSGRWGFWLEQKQYFLRQDTITQLFGLVNNSTCELDPFDALLKLGFMGCFANILLLVYLFLVPRRRTRKSEYDKILMFSNTLIVFISLFSGHVFFSSMGTMFVALSNSKVCKKVAL